MAFTGLTPSAHSSGERVRRGRITHAGNVHLRTQLVESAWAYRSRPGVGVELRRRQEHLERATVARAWDAQSVSADGSADSMNAKPTAKW